MRSLGVGAALGVVAMLGLGCAQEGEEAEAGFAPAPGSESPAPEQGTGMNQPAQDGSPEAEPSASGSGETPPAPSGIADEPPAAPAPLPHHRQAAI